MFIINILARNIFVIFCVHNLIKILSRIINSLFQKVSRVINHICYLRCKISVTSRSAFSRSPRAIFPVACFFAQIHAGNGFIRYIHEIPFLLLTDMHNYTIKL